MSRQGLRAVLLGAGLALCLPPADPLWAAARKRPTAAQRAAERRRQAAAKREAERQQLLAMQKAWQPDKGCYQAGSAFTEPRLKTNHPIEVPGNLRGGAMKAALLMYEAQLDPSGGLHSLRTLRPLPTEPPWPALHEAVVKEVRTWKWDRTRMAGKAVPVCFSLTLNLDLR